MAIYMKYGTLNGDATEKAHPKWIECNSLQWGVGRGISTPTGKTAHRETSNPSISEVTITKEMDASSVALFTESVVGVKGSDVEINVTRTGDKGGVVTFCKYVLNNCLVSGYSVSSGGDRPTESVSINFTKVTYTYTTFDGTNAAGSQIPVTYDLSDTTQS